MDTTSTAPHVAACLASFTALQKALGDESPQNNTQSLRIAAADSSGRFRVWSGNIGAHQSGTLKSSLDYRLKDAGYIKIRFIRLLKDLNMVLLDAISIAEGSRQGLDKTVGSDSSDSDLEDEDNGLDRPTEIEQIFLDITQIINSLYRLSMSVRDSTWRNRYNKSADIDTAHFEWFDIAHVEQKFPIAQNFIIDRLGKALSRRRQFLRYRELHAAKLAHAVDGKDTITAPSETTASGFRDPDREMASKDIYDLQSETSYATSVGRPTSTRVPSMPKEAANGQPFECPFCHTIEIVKGTHAWRKHAQLVAHLKAISPVAITEAQIPALIEMRATPVAKNFEFSCPLCDVKIIGRNPLQKHLGRHLEELALFALPNNLEEAEDDVDSQASISRNQSSLPVSREDSGNEEHGNQQTFLPEAEDADDPGLPDTPSPDVVRPFSPSIMDRSSSASVEESGLPDFADHFRDDTVLGVDSTANIICLICSNSGHLARDCPERQSGIPVQAMSDREASGPGTIFGLHGNTRIYRGGSQLDANDKVDREEETPCKIDYGMKTKIESLRKKNDGLERILEYIAVEKAKPEREKRELAKKAVEKYNAEEKEKAEKAKEAADKEYRERMTKTLRSNGYTEEEIEKILYKGKGPDLGSDLGSDMESDAPNVSALARPTYIKVNRKYLDAETLDNYHLPWEYDQIPEQDQDILFEHTHKLRKRRMTAELTTVLGVKREVKESEKEDLKKEIMKRKRSSEKLGKTIQDLDGPLVAQLMQPNDDQDLAGQKEDKVVASSRPRLTTEQTNVLEEHFQGESEPITEVKKQLAAQVGLSLDKVNNWYENRRAKAKHLKKQEILDDYIASDKTPNIGRL
ncbi:MAG: hypothetical protein Q9187_000980 [Circinaria calcarea]